MEATLQVIMEGLSGLSAGQSAPKSEISTTRAELKSDISTGQELLKSDIGNITEDKVGNCMSSITEELKTEMNDLRSEVSALESRINDGQAEMEETSERQ
jgi:polyhydroxyalkanoate synthesis regulator phasin